MDLIRDMTVPVLGHLNGPYSSIHPRKDQNLLQDTVSFVRFVTSSGVDAHLDRLVPR